jgi:hypothetical protein
VRGEEPVFVVTGRKEDVAKAKREILSAAEHFSLIRASRRPSLLGSLTGKTTSIPGPPVIPGQITIQVRVPYRVGECQICLRKLRTIYDLICMNNFQWDLLLDQKELLLNTSNSKLKRTL